MEKELQLKNKMTQVNKEKQIESKQKGESIIDEDIDLKKIFLNQH